MSLSRLAALALLAAAPAFAATAPLAVDFEADWAYGTDVNDFYNGGSASDGSTGGANLGVSFVNVSGLSNDANFTYYTGAPSAQGVAYAHDTAYMNVDAGVQGGLSFFYATPVAITGAVQAWSGANGTGTLLGSFDLAANTSGGYDAWNKAVFTFAGTAKSFELSASSYVVAFDNIAAVPEPASVALMLAGLGVVALRRRKA